MTEHDFARQRLAARLRHSQQFLDIDAAIDPGQLVVHHVDVRNFSPSDLGLTSGSFKVVANIPYYLSGLLFRTFLSGTTQPSLLVFLVQKEVAKRATADISKGEKESLLSLSIKAFGEPSYIKTVSRGHFNPPPAVESGIIAVRNISNDNFKDIDPGFFFEILHLGFGQKRKQLLGNLSNKYDREQLALCFSEVSIPPQARAEDLPLTTWLELVAWLSKTK